MKISEIISDWYKKNKRDLPWRNSNDPFNIWLSEIILQQTRVEQGIPYYNAFVGRYSNVEELANDSEDSLLKLWQGLGYYSRARNLHAAAKQVMNEFNGHFPTSYDQIIKLKGVGPYTAAAIASIAFDEPKAAVDGNVYRVLSRIFAIDTPVNSSQGLKSFAALADQLLDRANPGLHNQAMMEFGAICCVPVQPDCTNCPVNTKCLALEQKRVGELPVKIRNRKVKKRYFFYLVLEHNGDTYIYKRVKDDIWKHMYEFPLIESKTDLSPEKLNSEIEEILGLNHSNFDITRISEKIKHVLSHQLIEARFIHIRVKNYWQVPDPNWVGIAMESVEEHALPRLVEKYVLDH